MRTGSNQKTNPVIPLIVHAVLKEPQTTGRLQRLPHRPLNFAQRFRQRPCDVPLGRPLTAHGTAFPQSPLPHALTDFTDLLLVLAIPNYHGRSRGHLLILTHFETPHRPLRHGLY